MTVLCRIGTPDEVEELRRRAGACFGDEVVVAEPRVASRTAGTVVVPWIRRPHSLAPVATAAKLLLRGRVARWLDLDGATGRCGFAFYAVEGLRGALFAVLDLVLRGAARATALLRPSEGTAEPSDGSSGAPVIVLPVLPDLSHTFVYRECARLKALEPALRIIALERGPASAPWHPEARALEAHVRFLPRRGIAARWCDVLGWLLREPRRCSHVLRAYLREPGGTGALFGKLPLREPRHPGNLFALATLLRDAPPGPIHVYGSAYSANVALGAAALLGRRASISSYVDFDVGYAHRMLGAKLAASAFFRVCTDACRTRLRALEPAAAARAKLPVIFWALDLREWPRRETAPEPGLLFTACRLVAKKGLAAVPQALAALRDDGVDVRWRVAGDGPERDALEALVARHGIADRVELLGPLTSDRVRAEIDRADLALLPCVVAPDGERDGIPNFLCEAMARGVPVLTTAVSGIPELVIDGITGFLTLPDDPHRLAQRIAEVLADRLTLRAVGARGSAQAHVQLDVDRTARELLALIRGEGAP